MKVGFKEYSFIGHFFSDAYFFIFSGPAKCRYCERCFKTSWHVRRHERIHTGEKPYSCEICGKAFAEKGHMKSHMIVHLADRNQF